MIGAASEPVNILNPPASNVITGSNIMIVPPIMANPPTSNTIAPIAPVTGAGNDDNTLPTAWNAGIKGSSMASIPLPTAVLNLFIALVRRFIAAASESAYSNFAPLNLALISLNSLCLSIAPVTLSL